MIHTAVALTRTEIIPAEALLTQESFSTFTLDQAETLSPTAVATGKGRQSTAVPQAVERQHILRILEEVGGNKRRVVKALGIYARFDRKLV